MIRLNEKTSIVNVNEVHDKIKRWLLLINSTS